MIASVHLTLILSPDNPSNTTITDVDTGKVVYKVLTTFDPKTVTTLTNATGGVVAKWEWHEGRSDVLTLGENSPVPSSAWLKKSLVPFNDSVTFAGPGDKTYKWKGNSPGSSLELFSPDDKSSAVARFRRSHRVKNNTTQPPSYDTIPAQLTLASSVVSSSINTPRGALQDLIITSFLMLERKRRINEVSTVNRAEAIAQPLVVTSIGGTT